MLCAIVESRAGVVGVVAVGGLLLVGGPFGFLFAGAAVERFGIDVVLVLSGLILTSTAASGWVLAPLTRQHAPRLG